MTDADYLIEDLLPCGGLLRGEQIWFKRLSKHSSKLTTKRLKLN